jgi:hypothetical protein
MHTGAVAYGPRQQGDLRPLYRQLASRYRVMIYSGDTDACVPTVGTEEWTAALDFPVLDGWRPWHAGTNQNATAHFITAGYVTVYNAATPTTVAGDDNGDGVNSSTTTGGGQCPMFSHSNCSIGGGDVVGFSTLPTTAACCSACAANSGCRFFLYRNTDQGCTQYSTIVGALTPSVGPSCGSYVPSLADKSAHLPVRFFRLI